MPRDAGGASFQVEWADPRDASARYGAVVEPTGGTRRGKRGDVGNAATLLAGAGDGSQVHAARANRAPDAGREALRLQAGWT